MENKPTQEQIRELWEWCGWVLRPDAPKILFTGDLIWTSPELDRYGQVQRFMHLPVLDLNNLFKYAIPKLTEEKQMPVEMIAYPHHDTNLGFSITINGRHFGTDKGDPALALFWSIWEVIHADRQQA